MLAGEPFSDHPKSVCPVIGAVLRAYNDWADDERRQDLYTYASKVVGSNGAEELERVRAERVISWISAPQPRRGIRWVFAARSRSVSPEAHIDLIGAEAVRSLQTHSDRGHTRMLGLVDELLALGSPEHALPAGSAPAVERGPGRLVGSER